MMITKRLILFRRLGPAELRIARLLRLAGFEIRFLEPVGALRSEVVVDRLRGEGIVWLKANEIAGIDAFAPIAAGHQLTLRMVDRFFPLPVLTALGGLMPSPADDPSKLRILLYELVRGYLMPHGLAITVARLLRGRGYRVWLWQQDAVMLSLARPDVRNLCPAVLSLGARFAGKLLGRRRQASSVATSAAVADVPRPVPAPAGTAEVLYFPHQGPFYSDLFVKDQYYADDPSSPFHPGRICHVELAEQISPQGRATVDDDYRRAGIAAHWLPPYGRMSIPLLDFVKLAVRLGPVAAALGLMLRHRLAGLQSRLSAFPKAKLALLGYESLFPRAVAAALQARGIAVAAAQERFVQPFHPGFHLILDHYLMHGERPANAVRSNPLCQIGAVVVTGDLRQPNSPAKRREGPHRCLVLDYHSASSPFVDAFAIANGWVSNRIFLEDVLRLSADFPEVHFTIRGKDSSWIDLPVSQDIVARVTARPNLTVDQDRTFDRSAALLVDSDSVVARHTSLGDQALAMGIPVLFHERMATGECSIAAVMDYAPYPLLTRSYEELHTGFAAILRDGHILEAAQIASLRRELYAQPADTAPKKKAAAILGAILAGAANTPYHHVVGAGC